MNNFTVILFLCYNVYRKKYIIKRIQGGDDMVGIDITGKRFGYLTAIQLAKRENKNTIGSRRRWRCLCDCGNEIIVEKRLLTTQRQGIKSCGCIRKKAHLLVTSKCPWLTMKYLWSFKGDIFLEGVVL